MPSTITAYYTFTAATKARSSQVNTNFSNYRGDLLPINEATVTASDNTHYLGSTDHYWAGAYVGQVDFRTATTTATLTLSGDTSATTGAFLFKIEGTEVFRVGPGGFISDSYLTTTLRQLNCVTVTASGVWTVPAGVTNIMLQGCGGGGGGGGGGNGIDGSNASGDGGGGGAASPLQGPYPMQVTPLSVLTITVGIGGAGGAVNSTGTAGGDSMISGGVFPALIIFGGAKPGSGAVATGGGATQQGGLAYQTSFAQTSSMAPVYYGGNGGAGNGTGVAAPSGTAGYVGYSVLNGTITGGAGGNGTSGGGGGGGGGNEFGVGGLGGDGDSNGGAPSATAGATPTTTAYGCGGGGGGGGAEAGSEAGGAGGAGMSGVVFIYYIK